MFLSGMLLWLIEHGWVMLLSLVPQSAFPKPLSPEEEARLIREMRDGGESARVKLIEHNLRLVAHIAKKYAQSGVDQEDLVSIGSIGLMKAIATFQPEAGRLTTYAARCIENEMLMALRANKKHKSTALLSESAATDADGNELPIEELIGTEPDMIEAQVETAIEAERAMRLMESVLDSRELSVIQMRYGLTDGQMHPQKEVGAALGISRSYVSRIETQALKKLRREMDPARDKR